MNQTQLGNFWVFREGRKNVDGQSFLRQVLKTLEDISQHHVGNTSIIRALVLAGQLESALADTDSSSPALAQSATDFLADLLVGNEQQLARVANVSQRLACLQVPEQLTISPPEGFAYYALHPSDFACMAERVSTNSGVMAVVGIRSIGTTLSAVVSAALRHQGHSTTRITVRPDGHPYNRVTEFNVVQRDWIHQQLDRNAHFLVADEGPGRSGSSFLSVAEALVRAGVKPESIILMGSRAVDPSVLCAEEAATRWSQFCFLSPVVQTYERFKEDFYVGGGEWRNFFHAHLQWPESWLQMERLKFLSADRAHLFKFEGFGQFGKDVLERATVLSCAGFGPAAEDASDGMICYSVIAGKRPCRSDVSGELLEQIVNYCAFRAREFACREPVSSQLGEMTRFNLQEQVGADSDFLPEALATANPVLVDGRMQPHEWVLADQRLIKLDGTTHGDDHFFPGPTDIAWDLAGTIVEWELDRNATEFLLERFRRATGDDVRNRVRYFLLAYTIFRLGYCSMALTTVKGTPEEPRLTLACEKYQSLAARFANAPSHAPLPTFSMPGVEHPTLHLGQGPEINT